MRSIFFRMWTAAQGITGHKDDNAIILSAYGRNLLSDQLFYSYGTGPIKNYLTSAKAHNTITIDGANQSTTKKGSNQPLGDQRNL